MKNIGLWIAVLVCGVLQAQKPLNTIYANDKKNVALFFPEAIVQGITGASHFVFTYNREKEQYFGLLQAQPGEESNLLVVTDTGAVYSFILKYTDSLPKLNYFIDAENSIASAVPVKERLVGGKKVEGISGALNEFKQFCEYLLKSKPRNLKRKRKAGITVQLERIAYYKSETYLVIEVSNASGIRFDIDFLNVYRVSGKKSQNASYQRILLKPLYRFQMPSSIKNVQRHRFVLVFERFVLGDHQRLQVELQEANGGRGVVLNNLRYP